MTMDRHNVVRLSSRDWISIVAIVIGIMGSFLGAYLHHDRLLTRVAMQQEMIDYRLSKIEQKIENR